MERTEQICKNIAIFYITCVFSWVSLCVDQTPLDVVTMLVQPRTGLQIPHSLLLKVLGNIVDRSFCEAKQ